MSLVAPDLRGRGLVRQAARARSACEAHADDLVAVLDHLELDRAVLAGHSMGAYVATTAATEHRDRWSHVVLVDGGVALPLPPGVEPGAMLAGVLGPGARAPRDDLRRPGRVPRLLAASTPRSPNRARGTRTPRPGSTTTSSATEPELRSSAAIEAVRFDGTELLIDHEVRHALYDLTQPAVLLRAPRGLLNQVPPLLPDEIIDPLRARWPIRLEMLVEDTNHYSILLAPRGARVVARHLEAAF